MESKCRKALTGRHDSDRKWFLPKVVRVWALVLLTSPVWANGPYYVDADSGSDTSYNGLASTIAGATGPFQTLTKARDTINALGSLSGTTYVYVKPATATYRAFNGTALTKGTSATPIIWEGTGGSATWTTAKNASGQAILDGANSDTYGFWIQGSGVTIDNFEIRNLANGSKVGTKVYLNVGILWDDSTGATGNSATNCSFHKSNGQYDTWVWAYNTAASPTNTNHLISGCTFGDATLASPETLWAAVNIQDSPAITIQGCRFVRMAPSSSTGTIINQNESAGNSNNEIVRNCLFYNNGVGWAIWAYKNLNVVITGNTIVDNSTSAAPTTGTGGIRITPTSSAAVLRNNIVYVTNTDGRAYDVYVDKTLSSSNYNCFFDPNFAGLMSNTYNGTAYSTLSSWQTGSGQDAQSLATDAQFVSTSTPDWHLRSTFGHWNGTGWTADGTDSPCIDAGTPSPYLRTNILASSSPATVTVTSTRGFPSTGSAYVVSSGNQEKFNYTGIKATQFTGVTWPSGQTQAHTALSDRVYADDTTSTGPTPASMADWTLQTMDNGGRVEIGYYGAGSQASLAGIQGLVAPANGVAATWVGGNVNTWTYTSSGEDTTNLNTGWNNPANWSTAAIPTANDDAYIVYRGASGANAPLLDAPLTGDTTSHCNNLTISNASNNNPSVSGGTLNLTDTTARTLTAAGNVTFNGLGSAATNVTPNITVSSAAHTLAVGGNWNDSAASGGFVPAIGTVNFNGTGTIALRTAATANNFYNLTVSAGTRTITTNANANGNLKINGGVTISGTGVFDATGAYTLTVLGNWTNNVSGGFTQRTSTVSLSGGSAQTVGGSANTTFYALTLINSSGFTFGDATNASVTFGVASALTWTAGNVQVGQGALGDTLDFQPTSTTLTIPSGISLTLNAASRLSLGSGDTLTVTGTLATINTSAGSTAGVSTDAGYCAVNLNGAANISYLNWDGLQSTGVVVGAGATLTGWNNITFGSSQGGANSLYLDLSACTNTTALPNTMNACWFSAGTQFNVKGNGTRTDVTKKLYFINYGGPMAGESLETGDSIDWIRWGGGVVLRNGTSDVATYGSIQDAVNAATATNYWIEVRDNVIRNESINLSTFNFTGFTNGLVIEGAVMSPSSTGPSIIGSGNTGNEILQNCVFLRPSGSSRVLVQDVGRMIHCDLLGNPADGTLATFGTNGSAYQLWACIVGYPGPPGSPNAWPSASPVLTQTAGTLTVSYCDLGGAVSGAYTPVSNLASSDPLLVNFVPGDGITTGKGIYDVHLQSTSPCIDKAPVPAAPFVNVTTDLNRGTDISDPSVNTHVPPYAGNPDRPIYALSDPNHTSTTPYDVGAVEYGPGTIGSPAKPQSLPLWTRQTGPSLGATGGSVTDMIPTYDFATYALIVGDNISTTSQKVHALDMNSGNEVTGVTPYDLYASVSTTITHIFRISVVKDAGATDSVYCVVNTTGDTSGGPNAIVALTYNGSAFSPKSGWTNPVMGSTGSGRMGMVVVDSSGNIAFVKGRRLYYLNGSSGAAMTGTYWAAADGHEKASSQGAASDDIFDAEGAPFIDVSATNNIIQVPLAGHPTDQVWRIQLSDGSKTAAKQAVVQTYEINDAGFNQIGGRIYVTPSQSDFVVALNHINFTNVWTSDNLLANVTSRAQTFLRSDGDVRVVVRNTVFRIAKSTGNGLNGGNVALDSATSGSHDWGTSNPMRGDITTSPFIVGSRGVGLTNGRTGAQMFFGTNLGMCYVLSYIRNTTGNYAVDNDNQPADSGSVMLVTDGKPYPGFPYRIMGGKADGTAWSQVGIQSVTLGYSSTYGVNLLIFAVDNGWIYAFPEPY